MNQPTNAATAWEVILIRNPNYGKPRGFWSFLFKDEPEFAEAGLLFKMENELMLIRMSDRGWGFILDWTQWPGEVTAFNIDYIRFALDAKTAFGGKLRVMNLFGNRQKMGEKLDSFKAIAYIFQLPEWKKATAETLLKFKA